MGRCKVRIHRLTLALGVLGNMIQNEEDRDDEEDRILAQEVLHNAMEVSVASSSSWKVLPHVHGITDMIGGRFWASGSNSKTDLEEDIMVDKLVTYMRNLSIKSPAKSTVLVLKPSLIVPFEEVTSQVVTTSIHVQGSKIRRATPH
jgi:hypothetical protein